MQVNLRRQQLRSKDAEKLTSEEIEQFTRNSTKEKRKAKETSKESWNKELASLVKLVGNEEFATNQLKQIYKLKNKEVPDGI